MSRVYKRRTPDECAQQIAKVKTRMAALSKEINDLDKKARHLIDQKLTLCRQMSKAHKYINILEQEAKGIFETQEPEN